MEVGHINLEISVPKGAIMTSHLYHTHIHLYTYLCTALCMTHLGVHNIYIKPKAPVFKIGYPN